MISSVDPGSDGPGRQFSTPWELRRLGYFLALAEELHFGRAATRLHVTQSALSQQIAVLEREVCTRLLVRTSRGVRLTETGRVLHEGIPALLQQSAALHHRVRESAEGTAGVLRVAHTRSAVDVGPSELIRRFRSSHPGVRVQSRSAWTSRNMEQLRVGEVDVAFLRSPGALEGLAQLVVATEELVVVLPSSHPLALWGRIPRESLRDEPVVFWPRDQGPGYYDLVISQVWSEAAPRIIAEEPDAEHILQSVAAGDGVAVLDRARAEKLATASVTVRSFADVAPVCEVVAAWREDVESPVVARFVTWLGRRAQGTASSQ